MGLAGNEGKQDIGITAGLPTDSCRDPSLLSREQLVTLRAQAKLRKFPCGRVQHLGLGCVPENTRV